MENNLKSGTCPKCGSNEIYTTAGKMRYGDRYRLMISAIGVGLDTYFCRKCGHFEEYISDEDLKNGMKVEDILKKCVKVI
jgi:hypothetical protein